jgi:hypothetical protein
MHRKSSVTGLLSGKFVTHKGSNKILHHLGVRKNLFIDPVVELLLSHAFYLSERETVISERDKYLAALSCYRGKNEIKAPVCTRAMR